MTTPIVVNIVGLPAPQGSKTRMPNGAMVDGGSSSTGRANLASWRSTVRAAAAAWCAEHGAAPLAEPVQMDVRFFFPLPASDPYRWRHSSAPDLSKLLRSTEDALVQGGLLADDRLICDVTIAKRYAQDRPIGADVRIWPLGAHERQDRARLQSAAAAARKAARLAAVAS